MLSTSQPSWCDRPISIGMYTVLPLEGGTEHQRASISKHGDCREAYLILVDYLFVMLSLMGNIEKMLVILHHLAKTLRISLPFWDPWCFWTMDSLLRHAPTSSQKTPKNAWTPSVSCVEHKWALWTWRAHRSDGFIHECICLICIYGWIVSYFFGQKVLQDEIEVRQEICYWLHACWRPCVCQNKNWEQTHIQNIQWRQEGRFQNNRFEYLDTEVTGFFTLFLLVPEMCSSFLPDV